jgi:hypothetical protein
MPEITDEEYKRLKAADAVVNKSLYKAAIFALCNMCELIIHDLNNSEINLNVRDDKNITDAHTKGIKMLDDSLAQIETYMDKLSEKDKQEAGGRVSELGKQATAELMLNKRAEKAKKRGES